MGLLVSPARSLPQTQGNELLRTFATCAGRLSATMEYQWMFDGPESERTDRSVNGFDVLIEAVMGPEITGRQLMGWRIDAKIAQARLLNLAAFGQDPRLRVHAAQMAEQYLNQCKTLLLQ